MSDSLWPHGLQHARLPCPLLSPRACSNSCPLRQWCYLTISSSVTCFSFCLQSFPASVFSDESALRLRWPKYWSFSFNIIPSNEHPGLISFRKLVWPPCCSRDSPESSPDHNSKASILRLSIFFKVQVSHLYMITGTTIALTIQTFVGKVLSLLLNMLSRIVMVFLPRSKHLLISWLQSESSVILKPKKIKSVTVYTFSPSICHEVMSLDA